MQQIRIDFDNPGLPQSLGVVEGESQSRIFQAALYKSGAAYTAPAGAAYSIMYRGFGPQNQGWYDTIEDGAGKRAACTVSGNVVTCELARQALRVPGHLTVVLCVSDSKGYMLKSWPIMADVRNDGYEDTGESEMYFNLSGIAGNYLTQLEKAMANAETIQNNLTSTATQAKKDVTDTATKTKSDIDAKAAETLKSIPESYTELDGSVKQLKEDLINRGKVNGGKNLIGNKANKLYAVGNLPSGTKLTLSTKDGGFLTGANLNCYDKSKTYMQYFNAYSDNKKRTFTLDYDTYYISLSKAVSDRPMQLEIGERVSAFEEYTANVLELQNELDEDNTEFSYFSASNIYIPDGYNLSSGVIPIGFSYLNVRDTTDKKLYSFSIEDVCNLLGDSYRYTDAEGNIYLKLSAGEALLYDTDLKTITAMKLNNTSVIVPKKFRVLFIQWSQQKIGGELGDRVEFLIRDKFAETQIISLNQKIESIDKRADFIIPTLRNGSVGNPNNVNAVSTNEYIDVQYTYSIKLSTTVECPTGYHYYWVAKLYDSSKKEILDADPLSETNKEEIEISVPKRLLKTCKYAKFGLFISKDEDSTEKWPLRISETGNCISIRRHYLPSNFFDSIIQRNCESLSAVNSAANYGWNEKGKYNINKCMSMLVTTDVHGSSEQMANAIDYLNATESIDVGICLGDIVPSNYSQDADWYVDSVLNSEKPFYTVIGNHDGGNSADIAISGTKQQVFNKFILPTISKIGLQNLDKTYYSITYDDYKVVLIVIDVYDVPDTLLSDGNFAVSRTVEALSQVQIDWLIQQLKSIPSDYHLIIARHSGGGTKWTNDTCDWTMSSGVIESSVVGYECPVNEIVDAWTKGTSLKKEYSPQILAEYLPVISVDCDFTNRGTGIFATYLLGHSHYDVIAHDSYGNLGVQLDCTANDNWQTHVSDLPRTSDGKQQDCLTVVGIDTKRRLVKLVRIGSSITMTMTRRDMIAIPY